MKVSVDSFSSQEEKDPSQKINPEVGGKTISAVSTENFWQAPPLKEIKDAKQKELVEYGKELIAHTAKYLGPKGTVANISNGLQETVKIVIWMQAPRCMETTMVLWPPPIQNSGQEVDRKKIFTKESTIVLSVA